jgi:hypothetical protein
MVLINNRLGLKKVGTAIDLGGIALVPYNGG